MEVVESDIRMLRKQRSKRKLAAKRRFKAKLKGAGLLDAALAKGGSAAGVVAAAAAARKARRTPALSVGTASHADLAQVALGEAASTTGSEGDVLSPLPGADGAAGSGGSTSGGGGGGGSGGGKGEALSKDQIAIIVQTRSRVKHLKTRIAHMLSTFRMWIVFASQLTPSPLQQPRSNASTRRWAVAALAPPCPSNAATTD